MSSSPPGTKVNSTTSPSISDIYAKADARASAKGISHSLSLYTSPRPPPLHILIIGCGLGGLAAAHTLSHAGHRITLVESAPAIGEIGAGIQVTPNVSRLLIRWGLGERLRDVAVRPEAIALRRWCDGELVGWTRWGEVMDVQFGAPYFHIHRADFHRLLFDLAEPHMDLRLNSTVISINPNPALTTKNPSGELIPGPSVTLADGEVIACDLIVAADGVKSMVREVVLEAWEAEQAKVKAQSKDSNSSGASDGESATPSNQSNRDQWKAVPTGDAAYRAIVPTSKLLEDPDLKRFVEYSEMTGWMGPDRHIMAYCIRAKQEYNIVLIHPDDGSVESWTAEGSAEKMRKDFEGWEPRVTKLLSLVPSTLKWKLMDRQPLPSWVHPEGRVVLLGDACHPMLPYRAQGAAMAVEDAAVLGNLLSRLPHVPVSVSSPPSDSSSKDPTNTNTATKTTFNPLHLAYLLRTYESLRHARTSRTQSESRLNQRTFHHPDGPEQRARDASMREGMAYERAKWGMPEDILMGSGAGKEGFGPGLPADMPLEVGGGEKREGEGMMEGNANQWADQRKNREQFLYDADAEVERWWQEGGEESLGALTGSAGIGGSQLNSSSQAVDSAVGFGGPEQAQSEVSASATRMNARF